MARTSAISLLSGAAEKATLAEIYGIVIENVRKDTLSGGLKSTLYTGNPAAGSVEFKRFVNSVAKNYGTARTAGKGDAITIPPVPVNLSVHREIVEECSKFDLDTFGMPKIMARRAANHIDTMATDLDVAFFAAAAAAATEINPTGADEAEMLESMIVTLETTKNDYVQGVPRSMIVAVCSPSFYSKIRLKLDAQPKSNVDTAAEEFGIYHGVRVYNSINLPTGVEVLVMAVGSVAQPVVVYPYGDPEKIPLSNDWASSLFYDYGAKDLTPDLMFKKLGAPSVLKDLDVTSAAGTETVGDSVITVDPAAPGTGNKYVYKVGTTYANFAYDATLTGYTDLPADGVISVTGSSSKLTLAEVTTADGKARGRGVAIVVKKTS